MGRKKHRKHSIIDKLPPEIKDTVEEMVKANFTYREILEYLDEVGHPVSYSTVQRYASNLMETIQSIRLAQENFRAIMAETEKYSNLDVADGILRLLASQMLEAINQMPEEEIQSTSFDKLSKNAVALTRAVAYKRNIDLKDKLETGAREFKSEIFEAMAAEDPETYKKVKAFIESKMEVLRE